MKNDQKEILKNKHLKTQQASNQPEFIMGPKAPKLILQRNDPEINKRKKGSKLKPPKFILKTKKKGQAAVQLSCACP